jgi:hypothetical protein
MSGFPKQARIVLSMIPLCFSLHSPAAAGPALDGMKGRWSADGNCAGPRAVQISVFEDRVQFFHPDGHSAVEKVIQQTDSTVETVLESDSRGRRPHVFRYVLNQGQIFARDTTSAQEEIWGRCP